jgi:hypothetical protein
LPLNVKNEGMLKHADKHQKLVKQLVTELFPNRLACGKGKVIPQGQNRQGVNRNIRF